MSARLIHLLRASLAITPKPGVAPVAPGERPAVDACTGHPPGRSVNERVLAWARAT